MAAQEALRGIRLFRVTVALLVGLLGIDRGGGPPRPPALCLPRDDRAADLVAEPRDPGVRAVRGFRRGLRSRRLAARGRACRPRPCKRCLQLAGGPVWPRRRVLLGDDLRRYAAAVLELAADRLQVLHVGGGAGYPGELARLAAGHGVVGFDRGRGDHGSGTGACFCLVLMAAVAGQARDRRPGLRPPARQEADAAQADGAPSDR